MTKPTRRLRLKLPSGKISRLLLLCFVLLLIGRLSLVWCLPWAMDRAAAYYGLRCEVGSLDLDIFAGDVEVWHLDLTTISGDETVASLEYACAEIGVLSLFKGELVLNRAEIDGLDLLLERDSSGQWELLDPKEPKAPKNENPVATIEDPPKKTDNKSQVKPDPIDLTSPIRIDALRAQHVQITVRDRTASPPFVAKVDTQFRLSHLGSEKRKTRVELTVMSPELLDGLTLEATGSSDTRTLDSSFKLRLRGLHLDSLRPYLANLDLTPTARSIDLHMSGHFQARPQKSLEPESERASEDSDRVESLTAEASISSILLTADGEVAASLEHCNFEIGRLTRRNLDVALISISDGILQAERTERGTLRWAGLELTPNEDPTEAPETRAPALDSSPESPTIHDGPAGSPDSTLVSAATRPTVNPDTNPGSPTVSRLPARIIPLDQATIEHLLLEELRINLTDNFLADHPPLSFGLKDLSLRDLDLLDSLDPGTGSSLRASFASPGLFESMTIEGEESPFSSRKTASLQFKGKGIQAAAVAPYLAPLGIEPLLKSGTLTGQLEASLEPIDRSVLRGEIAFRDIRFEDGEELLGVDQITITVKEIDPSTSRIHLETVLVEGTRLAGRRDENGSLEALGFRVCAIAPEGKGDDRSKPSPQTTTPEQSPGPSFGAALPRVLPYLQIDRLAWKENQFKLTDNSMNPPTRWTLPEVGFEMTGLKAGGNQPESLSPGQIKAWIKAPGLLKEATLEGTLSVLWPRADLDLQVRANGLTTDLVSPYLTEIGFEGNLSEGDLALHLGAKLLLSEEGLLASASLDDLGLTQGGEELLGCDAVVISNASIDSLGVSVKNVEVRRPRLRATRDPEGTLHVLGLKMPKTLARPVVDSSGPPKSVPKETAKSKRSAWVHHQVDDFLRNLSSLSRARLENLSLMEATVLWRDDFFTTPVNLSGVVNAHVKNLSFGSNPKPGEFQAHLTVPENNTELTAKGSLLLGFDRQEAKLQVSATGLKAGALSPYFPDGVGMSLSNGSLNADISVAAHAVADGGNGATLNVQDMIFSDQVNGSGPTPLVSIESTRLSLARADTEAGIFTIDEILLTGLEAKLTRTESGILECAGITLSPVQNSKPSTPSKAPEKNPAEPITPSTIPAEGTLPLVTLGRLDLQVKRLSYIDELTGAAPVELTNLRFWNPEPIVMLGDEAWDRPPAVFQVQGKLDPISADIDAVVEALPFAPEPHLTLRWNLSGIEGTGVNAAAPALAGMLDATEFTKGRLKGEARVTLKTRRRHPLDFNLRRSFGVETVLSNIDLRQDGGPSLLSVEQILIDANRIQLETGEIRVRNIEVANPRGTLVRKEDGLRIGGLRFILPAFGPTSEGEVDLEGSAPANIKMQEPEPEPEKLAGEIAIANVLIRGVEFDIRDEASDPPVLIPISDLEIEVRGLSSQLLQAKKNVRFSIITRSSPVSLPENPDELTRPFGEVAASGQISLFPELAGYVKANVTALELSNFKGAADDFGVTLDDGVFDAGFDVRLPGDGSLQPRAILTLTDLDLSEDANGPISKYLQLPAPLDLVLFALRDEAGVIEIPLDLEIKKDGITAGEISRVAISTLGTLISNALQSSVFRVAGTVGNLTGLTSDDTEDEGDEALLVQFASGDSTLSASSKKAITDLIEKLRENEDLVVTLRHELGAIDLKKAAVRANPSAEDCRALASRLRLRKKLLLQSRAEVAAETRAALSSGQQDQAVQLRGKLNTIDHQLGALEDSLDRILSILRPGSEHHAPRRTLLSCISLGESRLAEVARALQAGLEETETARIRIPKPRFEEPSQEKGGAVSISITRAMILN